MAERERKDAERKAEETARAKREAEQREAEHRERESSSQRKTREDVERLAKEAITDALAMEEPAHASNEAVGSRETAKTLARVDVAIESNVSRKKPFPVWQIGAGIVILGLLIALSWHHLRPHSDEEGGASLATSPQAAATRPAPTTQGPPQNGSASGANEPSNGSKSDDGSGKSANAASSTGSGAGDAGGGEARGSGEGGKPGDAARTKKSQDTGGGVAGKRAPNAANGAGKSPSATTKPLANNANANPAASGGASTNAASSPLRVSATNQKEKSRSV